MIERKNVKDYLIESAIQLFSENDISKVSVRDICTYCSLSTRTYYNYFKDKNDIIAQAFVILTMQWYRRNQKEMTMHSLLIFMADEICSNSSFFRNAFSYKGQNNIRYSLKQPMQNMMEDLYRQRHAQPVPNDVKNALSFFIYGMLAYVEERIALRTIPSAQESVAYFENALPQVLKQAYYD